MPIIQSIETARAERIGAEGVTAAAFDDALARSAEALDWLRARQPTALSRCCACRRRAMTWRRSAMPRIA